ncbi:MAG: hypothetical protein IPP10_14635 [Candidatus Competibacteraceae bacterium]|nr:hypothetical protein [Candidatus Competibacteraceae bacterium]
MAPDITVFRNPGPLSPYTLEALRTLGIRLDETPRRPLTVYPADLLAADRIIALSRHEHEPMLKAYFLLMSHVSSIGKSAISPSKHLPRPSQR